MNPTKLVTYFHCFNFVYNADGTLELFPLLGKTDINGLVQDSSNLSALAMELLQSFTKSSISSGQKVTKSTDSQINCE